MLPYSVVNWLGVVAHVLQHRAQVLQVEQREAVVVGDLEHQVQHAGLRLVEREHARQQQRAHVGHGGAHRVALLGRTRPTAWSGQLDRFRRRQAALLEDRGHLGRQRAGLRDAGQVALHVGHEHRHADARQVLGERLQRDRLAGAGGAGDQPVPIGQRRQQETLDVAVLGDENRIGHVRALRRPGTAASSLPFQCGAGPLHGDRLGISSGPRRAAAADPADR